MAQPGTPGPRGETGQRRRRAPLTGTDRPGSRHPMAGTVRRLKLVRPTGTVGLRRPVSLVEVVPAGCPHPTLGTASRPRPLRPTATATARRTGRLVGMVRRRGPDPPTGTVRPDPPIGTVRRRDGARGRATVWPPATVRPTPTAQRHKPTAQRHKVDPLAGMPRRRPMASTSPCHRTRSARPATIVGRPPSPSSLRARTRHSPVSTRVSPGSTWAATPARWCLTPLSAHRHSVGRAPARTASRQHRASHRRASHRGASQCRASHRWASQCRASHRSGRPPAFRTRPRRCRSAQPPRGRCSLRAKPRRHPFASPRPGWTTPHRRSPIPYRGNPGCRSMAPPEATRPRASTQRRATDRAKAQLRYQVLDRAQAQLSLRAADRGRRRDASRPRRGLDRHSPARPISMRPRRAWRSLGCRSGASWSRARPLPGSPSLTWPLPNRGVPVSPSRDGALPGRRSPTRSLPGSPPLPNCHAGCVEMARRLRRQVHTSGRPHWYRSAEPGHRRPTAAHLPV
ncbi:MAG: hypothetical protein QOG96_1040 [Pseudonocardiales bacterium]|nr:hypothetical protein [Pseudonocardiales bacterium]